jgi:hypothetical protein
LCFDYDLQAQLRTLRSPRDVGRTARDFSRMTRARLGRKRPLVKDPIALLSAEWFAQRFGMKVVVLIRHPAAFAASVKRLGWRHRFETFFVNGRVPDVVRPYEGEIREQARCPGDVLDEAALLWRILYNAVDGYRQRQPNWIFLRHEDASADPMATFEQLYDRLGLELTMRARQRIERATGSRNRANPRTAHGFRLDSAASLGRWRTELGADEVELLRERTRDVWPRFYGDADW